MPVTINEWRAYLPLFLFARKNRGEVLATMGDNTKIYDKFEYWTVADCVCKFCINHVKKQPCPLEVCCIADIREEAARREQVAEWREYPCQT